MTRYVTLRSDDPDTGYPTVQVYDADREEVTPTVNEFTTDDAGNTTSHVSDPGGDLHVYLGDVLVESFPAGGWRSCSAESPDWFTGAAG